MTVIKYKIPVGYRFRPTDEDLLSFLHEKNNGKPLTEIEGKVLELRLHGEDANPWDVLKEDDPWDDLETGATTCKKIIYVFCKLIPVHGKTKNIRVCRTAGCGKWDGKGVGDEIKKGMNVIGIKKSFTFKRKEFGEEMEGRGRWIMHEYALPSSSFDDYVICKITKEVSRACVGDRIADSSSLVDCNGGDGVLDSCRKRRVSDVDVSDGLVRGMKKKKKQREFDGREGYIDSQEFAVSQEIIPFGEGTSSGVDVCESLAPLDGFHQDQKQQTVWGCPVEVWGYPADPMQNNENNCQSDVFGDGNGYSNANGDRQLFNAPADNYCVNVFSDDQIENWNLDPNFNIDTHEFLQDFFDIEPQQQKIHS